MSLHYPNASRSFDPDKRHITFWGSDRALELTFVIDDSALQKIGGTLSTEADFLATFDANRSLIEAAGAKAYERDNQHFHVLSASDF